jgi:hypothetical protein
VLASVSKSWRYIARQRLGNCKESCETDHAFWSVQMRTELTRSSAWRLHGVDAHLHDGKEHRLRPLRNHGHFVPLFGVGGPN